MKLVAQIFLIIIVLMLSGYLWYVIYKGPSQPNTRVEAKEAKIEQRDGTIKILRDSIRTQDSISAIHITARVAAEKQSELYRKKWEGLRVLRNSQNVDTLKVVIGVCDSTVLNQDTLINKLKVENADLTKANEQKKAAVDTLVSQVQDLKEVNVILKGEALINKRKEKWKKVGRTLRDIGIGITAFLLGRA